MIQSVRREEGRGLSKLQVVPRVIHAFGRLGKVVFVPFNLLHVTQQGMADSQRKVST